MITEILPLTRNKAEILFEIYSEKQSYLREIARATKKSPSLCAKSLNALFKSGIIKKSKSGKTIYYSLVASRTTDILIDLLDEFYLEKMVTKYSKLKALISLARNNGPLKDSCTEIYVFGSYARGTATEKSDVDMLFITDEKESATKFIGEASIVINKEINGIVLSNSELADAIRKKEPFVSSIMDNPKERLVVWKKA